MENVSLIPELLRIDQDRAMEIRATEIYRASPQPFIRPKSGFLSLMESVLTCLPMFESLLQHSCLPEDLYSPL